MRRLLLLPAILFLFLACRGGASETALEEARALRQAGHYAEAVALYEEALEDPEAVSPEVRLEYAETTLLASGAERSRIFRQKALEALCALQADTAFTGGNQLAELWRRLGWEMARDRDSLQAFAAFDSSLACGGSAALMEEEWLLRGVFASGHLALVAGIPDSIALSPAGDSMLAVSAEQFLLELDRIPLRRTDLRPVVLQARAMLLPFTDRATDELEVLTELDRAGDMDPALRERRMRLLLDLAAADAAAGRLALAREKLLEVWDSDFSGDRVEAAVLLGGMAEDAGRPDEALDWYRSACSTAPGLSSPAAALAAAKRDSLLYLLP
jgi:tetratricopeptide (TPR) repeat protein